MLKVKALKLTIALASGLIMALALTFIMGASVAFGLPRYEDHPNGDVISPTQTVSGTWGPGAITATADVTISPTVVITIAPGTTILVADGVGFTVLGNLHSNGPITFTTATSPAAPGNWGGVAYDSGSTGYLNRATVEYAVHALTLSTTNRITISNSTIRYNKSTAGDARGAGILVLGGNHLISNTEIHNDVAVGSAGSLAYGAGIAIEAGSSQVINSSVHNNVVTATNALGYGAGMAIRGTGAPLIEGNSITSNALFVSTNDPSSHRGHGGGIGVWGDTLAVIRDNLIAGNLNRSRIASGGGIGFADGAGVSLIEGNVIYSNTVSSAGGSPNYLAIGGGIDHWTNNSGTERNNLIYKNAALCDATCVYSSVYTGPAAGGLFTISSIRFVNNTVVSNTAGYGGGIAYQGGTNIENNIIAYNAATANTGGIYEMANATAPVINYNDVWNNTAGNYGGGASAGANDISRDPMFVGGSDVVLALHLRQGSPAIDSGSSTAPGVPGDDYDDQARPLGTTWDIGFDEVNPFTYTKSVNLAIARGNDPLIYTVVVTNPDPHSTFVGGLVTDILPSNTGYSSGPSCNLGACGYDGATRAITWSGNIPAGSALTLGYTVLVNAGLADGSKITNTAFITVGAVGKTTNAVTTTIYSPAFILTKHAGGTFIAGAPLTYTITVTNTSAQVGGSGVVVSDTLPTGANYITGGALLAGDVVSWTISSIPASSNAQVSFAVSTCQASLTNNAYRVLTSAQGVSSPPGPVLTSTLTPPTVNADFDYNPPDIATGGTLYFTDTSTTNGGPITGWAWGFGDGQTDTGPTASHLYPDPGVYTVTLVVTDTCLYTDTTAAAMAVRGLVTGVEPTPNTHTATVTTNLTVTVSGALNQTSVTTRTLVVHGGFQGHLSGTFSFGPNSIFFDPDGGLYIGELVETSVTTGVVAAGLPLARPYVWQFRTAVPGGCGFFSDNGQNLGSSSSHAVAMGDLDGDGDLDAFVANSSPQANKVWLNNGTGAFSDSGQSLGSSYSYDVALGDLDGDGDLDAFVTNLASGNEVWLNDGTGAFSDSGQALGTSFSYGVALGDVDGDGDLDAFVANGFGQPDQVWRNDGTGAFSNSGQSLGSSSSHGVALGDLDGDGDLDAFVANSSPQSDEVWRNDGTGAFTRTQSLGTSYSLDVALGDVDGDGDLDAFVANLASGNEVWLNNGAGAFSDSGQSLGSSFSYSVALGDVDGDGDLDAFVANLASGNKVWRNDGAGAFSDSGQGLGSSSSYGVALGDVDGDGDLDAFVANDNNEPNKVWLNCNRADLALSKTVSPGSAAPGQPITYTLVYTNYGPQAASGVIITDIVPISVTNASYTSSGAAITPTGSVSYTWQVGNLAPGGGGVITITGQLSAVLAAGVFTNTAAITGTALDTNAANNVGAAGVTVINVAPVARDDNYNTNENTTLTVTAPGVLSNDSDANGDPLTATLVSNALTGTLALQPSGGFVYTPALNFNGPVTFTYRASDGLALSNLATVTVTVRPAADLVVGKQSEPPSVAPGRAITYTLVVRNISPGDAPGSILSDTIPLEITSPTWVCAGAACPSGSGSGNISTTLNLLAGSAVTYTITGTVLASATGSLTNTASVTVPVGVLEINPSDNTTTTITPLTPQADLSISKRSSRAGTSITYTIAARNAGPSNASGATVSDPVPPGVSNFTWNCVAAGGAACGAPPSGTGGINQSVNLPPGGAVTYTVTGTIVASSTVVNTATVSAPPGVTDPVPGNNQAVDRSAGSGLVFLPIIMKCLVNALPPGPDLVVHNIIAASNAVTVVIRNQGDMSVTNAFWVDLYIDPNPVPDHVNQTWESVADHGAVWGVTSSALPLVPGQVFTLTTGGSYYRSDLSNISWPLAPSTPVYAQVDSANALTNYGAVLENHEMVTCGVYNNISGKFTVTVSSEGISLPAVVEEEPGKADSETQLPPRP